jgi:cobalt-zinc-cadmium efflux system outer membrane protein
MSTRRLFPLLALLLGGCLWPVQQRIEQAAEDLAAHPFDLAPPDQSEVRPAGDKGSDKSKEPGEKGSPDKGDKKQPDTGKPGSKGAALAHPTDIQTTAFMTAEQDRPAPEKPRIPELEIPREVPGSEAPPIRVDQLDPKRAPEQIKRLYPALPALPAEPVVLPGPEGQAFTLAKLQDIAAKNSPTLRQALADVETARGNLIQAAAYPNPTVGYEIDPSNDGETAGVQGLFIDQTVKTAGKLKLAAAAAEMDLKNAELAVKRARSDLATAVRNAWFGVLVARETMIVNRALAAFSDEVYQLQVKSYLAAGQAAPYEPMALRSQAYIIRLTYKQSISSYIYAWKQLVAAINMKDLPLSEVAGRVDRLIPYYDYDTVLQYVLKNHTDMLTSLNGIKKAQYNLKLAQVTPYPDFDFRVAILKEMALPPFQWVHTLQLSMPLPVWDQNKGNIIAAQGTLGRANADPQRVEVTLTNNLATAYANYKNNLDALEYYRRNILPDQVRVYRGVLARRQVDPGSAFADLVAAQQAVATDVAAYLTVLGQLWTSVVSVADFLQTDDLFQMAKPLGVPALPDLSPLHGPLPPGHTVEPAAPAKQPELPLPRKQPAAAGKVRNNFAEQRGDLGSPPPSAPVSLPGEPLPPLRSQTGTRTTPVKLLE